ncbi:MAG: hypothetical protein V4539_15385 [Bacteroidota bacterium]
MIKYFLKTGDEDVSKMFSPYVWQTNGLATLFERTFLNKDYGADLKLLLIMYYVEGRFDINGPQNAKVNNYSNKNKDISVAIAVTPELFHNKNEFERRKFIVDSTLNAVKLVRNKLEKRKLDIDFDLLVSDITIASSEFLKHQKLIAP